MHTSRSGAAIRVATIGLLLATPTAMLVLGALFFGFFNHGPIATLDRPDQISVIDPELAIGDENLESTLVTSVPETWDSRIADQKKPILISIPALSVASYVLPVSAFNGVMEIPEDISNVGWFIGSAPPGDTEGATVLVGHRDGVDSGKGAFYGLSTLSEGDLVTVKTEFGEQLSYQVQSIETVDKKRIPQIAAQVFSATGDPRLVLVTCGGSYVREAGGYQANVIVTATPMA